jgi:transposase
MRPQARRVAVTVAAGDGLLELALPSGARIRFPAGTDLAYLRALAAAL